MPLRRFPLIALIAGLAGALAASAGPAWKLPPLDGELAGEFTLLRAEDAAPLRWTMALHTRRPRERSGEFRIEGTGALVRAQTELDPAGEGAWRLLEARVDLGRWLAAAAPYLGAAVSGVSVQGTLEAGGEGTWRGGILGGRATLTLRDGRLDDPAHKLVLEGIAFTVEFEDLAARRTRPRQVLAWRGGHYDTFAIGEGRAVFELRGDELRVDEALVTLLGGELTLRSFVLSTKRPEMSVSAQVHGLDVSQILTLLPPVLASARGRLDGRISLTRTEAGIQIGTGRLALREGETAELRLTPTPGLLSASLPAAVLQHYPGLGKLEMGQVPLRAELLEVTFTPEGDAAGRTAWVHLAGGPVDPKMTAPIDLNVNVRGPLESLVKFGTNSRLHFGGAR